MKMREDQFNQIKKSLEKLVSTKGFYQQKLEDIDVSAVKSQEDFEKLPFTWKGDLREAYPLGLMAVPGRTGCPYPFVLRNHGHPGYHPVYTKGRGGLGDHV